MGTTVLDQTMSLFDVIRFPITDIYNNAELDALPEGIWLAWMEVLRPGMNIVVDKDRSTIVRIIQSSNMLAHIKTKDRSDVGGGGVLIKAQMTKRLREVIAAYEGS
jgi:hypothetical protein